MIARFPQVIRRIIHMCMAGMVDFDPPHLPIHKATELWASHELLLQPVEHFRCDGRHQHQRIEGTCSDGELRSHKCRIWPWGLATGLATGIAALVRHTRQRNHNYATQLVHYYPTIAQQTGEEPEFPPPELRRKSNRLDWPCGACRSNQPIDSTKHTRHLQDCRYPHDAPVDWPCKGCKAGHRRYHKSHTNKAGECRWATAEYKTARPRQGHHPRDPRRQATDNPTTDLRVDDDPYDDLQHPDAASSNAPAPTQLDDIRHIPPEVGIRAPVTPPIGSPRLDYRRDNKPPITPAVAIHRATPTRTTEAGAQAHQSQWSQFDLGRSLQLLRSLNQGVVQRTLRMLHIRWWHVQAERFRRILQAAGAPEKAIKQVDDIVDTCRACRTWRKPTPVSHATARLVDKFNERCQVDLMFVSPNAGQTAQQRKQQIPNNTDPDNEVWLHIICVATRLSQAAIIPNKSCGTILNTIDRIWIRPYGPPTYLESDREGALNSDEARICMERLGVKLSLLGVDAHTKMLEKHQDLLRQLFLRILTQCQLEGIPVTREHILTCALTAKNCMFTVGDTTPTVAVFGRQSPILPNIERLGSTLDDTHTGPDGTSRSRFRLQEIATQQMAETTAIERAQRALTSKTRPTLESKQLELGSEVEFYRNPGQKDTQGWRGPGEVLKVDKDHVDIKWQGSVVSCRPQDVRLALLYMLICECFWHSDTSTKTSPWQYLLRHVEQLPPSTVETIAIIHNDKGYTVSQQARQSPQLLHAILRIASCELHLCGCTGARLAYGPAKLKAMSNIQDSLLWFWPRLKGRSGMYARIPADRDINMKQLHQQCDHTNLCTIQFLIHPLDEIDTIQQTFPHIPNLATPGDQQNVDMHIPMAQQVPLPPPPQDLDMDARARTRSRSLDSQDSTNPAPHKSQCLPYDEDADAAQDIIARAAAASRAPADVTPAELPPVPDSDDEMLFEETIVTPFEHPALFCTPTQTTLDDLDTPQFTDQTALLVYHGFTPDTPIDDDDLEFYIPPELAHWDESCVRALEEDEWLVFIINKSRVSAVIRRDCDNLTPQDIADNKQEVEIAMLDELRRWSDLKCFGRMRATEATNVIDGTWVIKFKRVPGTDSANKPIMKKIVKARLTARGFKDLQAYQENISTFSGTSTKAAQRLVCGHAAQHGYELFSMDISAAFLKGMTFEQIAKVTGKPIRSVQFKVPANTVHLLKRLPGMADFDPTREVLNFLKAMWGLKDAPRAFGMQRDAAFREFGARPTIKDGQLWVKTNTSPPRSLAMFSSHLGDVKGSAEKSQRQQLAQVLRKYFGEDLKENIRKFEFTGVQHVQHDDMSVTTHQDHYILELSTVPTTDTHINPDDDVPEHMASAFTSLLGGLAWLLVTRADIAPYVGFMQRLAGKPKFRHIRMINKVLKYCKRVSAPITYKRINTTPRLLCVCDSAYQSNEGETDCIALRGYFIFLASSDTFPGGQLQLIDFASRRLHVISRSAFAAELRNTLEAMEETINYSIMFHDIYRGPLSPQACVDMRETASHFLHSTICIDNFGLFAAVTKDEPSPGSDHSMPFHVKAARSHLDNHSIEHICWIDNRDMIADGLTKGRPPRDMINLALANGVWQADKGQPPKSWTSSEKRGSQAHKHNSNIDTNIDTNPKSQ